MATLRSPFRGVLLLVAGVLGAMTGCAAPHDDGLAAKTAYDRSAALERSIEEDSVGVSTRPPPRSAPPQFEDADAEAVRLFHDVLEPYGAWVDDPRLGYVWVPSAEAVGASFVPYGTNGHWTYRQVEAVTAEGTAPFHEYVWVSDLPWGWVTFHYGRWAYAGERGWAWVAGRRYGGAWVDWRAPHDGNVAIGWGPTPPSHVWRLAPGARPTRSRAFGPLDPNDARIVATPYVAFATPYVYAQTKDLFTTDLGSKLLPAEAALAVAYATDPGGAPAPRSLGFRAAEIPAPPSMDRGLQQAWMLATPASAAAVGRGPELGPPPRLRTWVAGGPRYAVYR